MFVFGDAGRLGWTARGTHKFLIISSSERYFWSPTRRKTAGEAGMPAGWREHVREKSDHGYSTTLVSDLGQTRGFLKILFQTLKNFRLRRAKTPFLNISEHFNHRKFHGCICKIWLYL